MQIETAEVHGGMIVFFPHVTATGNIIWKQGRVMDMNEHVRAVKLEYATGPKSVKREWFPVAKLRLTEPAEEAK